MAKKWSFEPARFLPFRDTKVLSRVRKIRKKDICKHPSRNFEIRIIEDSTAFAFSYVIDIVSGIKRALDAGRKHVIILPAPNPYYAFVAQMINMMRIPCKHVHTFNMDEYADLDGRTAPKSWKGGFQYWMWHDLFGRLDPKLAIPERQIHFPSNRNIGSYSRMIEDMGGADICYGGIGWAGHIAFFDPHLGEEFGDDIKSYLKEGARMVELHPITICQNSLFCDAECAGDLANVPPMAATIGPRDLAGAKLVDFWDGFAYGDVSWQRFITRLAAHGPVTPMVPASILQILHSRLTLSGNIAADCVTECGERKTRIERIRE